MEMASRVVDEMGEYNMVNGLLDERFTRIRRICRRFGGIGEVDYGMARHSYDMVGTIIDFKPRMARH